MRPLRLRYNQSGITLIELLVVIVIVGILAAVAIPSYTGYLQRSRRADAKVALEQLRAAQEMFRAERGRYVNTADGNPLVILQNSWGVPRNPVGDYVLVITSSSPTGFIAQATPNTARQLGDGDLFIDQNGRKWDSDGYVYPDPRSKWAK